MTIATPVPNALLEPKVIFPASTIVFPEYALLEPDKVRLEELCLFNTPVPTKDPEKSCEVVELRINVFDPIFNNPVN